MSMIAVKSYDDEADPLAAMRANYRRLNARPVNVVPVARVNPVAAWRTGNPRPVEFDHVIFDIPWYWGDLGTMPLSAKVKAIKLRVADQYGVTLADIDGPSQLRKHILPRFLAIKQVRATITHWSTVRIGHEFGGRDHTTVLNALKHPLVWKKSGPK